MDANSIIHSLNINCTEYDLADNYAREQLLGAVTKEQHDADIQGARDLAEQIRYDALEEVGMQVGDIYENFYTKKEVDEKIAGPQYELVQRVVTTKDETRISFEFETDDFVLFVETPASTAASGGNVGIYKNTKQVWNLWMSNMVITAGPSHFAVYCKNDKGLCFMEYVTPSNATASTNKTVGRAPFYVDGNTPFTKLTLNNTSGFPIGTKAELWNIPK